MRKTGLLILYFLLMHQIMETDVDRKDSRKRVYEVEGFKLEIIF